MRVTARAVNGSVELAVGNTGEGIPPERASHLFERFYRVRGDERVGGSGLGLSTARELARAHGGEIVLAPVRRDLDGIECPPAAACLAAFAVRGIMVRA